MTEKIKNKSNVLGFITIIFSLGAFGFSSYLYYQGLKINKELDFKINTLKLEALNQAKINRDSMAKLGIENDNLQKQLINLNKNSQNFNLFQLNELVSMSNQSLLVYNDVKSAIKILNYAMNFLNSNNDASYMEMKVSISNDIEKLNQIQYIDTVLLASKLNIIQNQITALSLIQESDSFNVINNNNKTPLTNSNITIWQKFVSNLKNTFASLVTISSSNQSQNIQLLPEKELIVRQNIKLDLLNSRIALLDHNQALWNTSLTSIKNNLREYFVNNSLTNAIISNIDLLLQSDISNKSANIDDTLKSLVKLNNNHNNKVI